MAYRRFFDSDVYIYASTNYPTGNDALECCGCILVSGCFTTFNTPDMIEHVTEHKRAGHDVGDFEELVTLLTLDDKDNFPNNGGSNEA